MENLQNDSTSVETPDRRDLLIQQLSEVEEQHTPAPEREPEPQVAKAPAERPVSERPRDPTGKFIPAGTAKAPQTKDSAALTAQAAPETPVQEPVWKKPPGSWKKDYHEFYSKADPKLQEYVFQREEQMRKGVEGLIPKGQFADRINKEVEPYIATIKGLGIDVPTAIGSLMKADHTLRTSGPQEKAQYFAKLAQVYGVDLQALFGVAQTQPRPDPNYSALANELNQIKGQFKSLTEAQEQARNAEQLREIQKFSEGKEHFEALRPTMVQLLQAGVVENLSDAYDKALRLNDDVFEKEQQARQAKAAEEERQRKDQAAKTARSRAVSVRSSTPGTNTAPQAKDRRSMLSEQLDSVGERL
jgi:hypothetical protein